MAKSYFSGLSKNTVLLTLTSFFADISTEMLYPIFPVFLTQQLHASGGVVGLIEGIATATQNIVQGFSGWYADRIQRRKPIALLGYTLAALAKPLIGFSPIWQTALGARFLDRFGTGTRSAPRDGLIAASAKEESRGKAFGLEGIGDNLGAFVGPLVTVVLLVTLHPTLRTIFYLTCIPGFLAVFMIMLVKEGKPVDTLKRAVTVRFSSFSRAYWVYLAITFVIGMSMFSTSFLILRTKELGVPLTVTILIYAGFNLVAALASYPAGYLADLLGRKWVFVVGLTTLLASYLGFALTTNLLVLAVLFILYGVYQGMFRAVGKAMATDYVTPSLRASGVGWYASVIGVSGLVASIVAGQLWDKLSHPSVFVFGILCATLGTIFLMIFVPNRAPKTA